MIIISSFILLVCENRICIRRRRVSITRKQKMFKIEERSRYRSV